MNRHEEVILVSTVLFGKYQLCGILGTGREGTVFLAVHLGLEEYRAVKRVSKSFLNYEQFRREALILKELRHPGIPIVYDVEEDESYSYLIEEYLEGDSLYDLVKKQGHLSRELTVFYGIQLASIINYLHLAGTTPILHLDLQPKNLLLCHDTIKLIDFGLAASLKEANEPGERYGTVGCAAPEQYQTDGALDERTDIYAIGTILCYLCTGKFPALPFIPDSPVDPGLAAVIGQCVCKEKENRFSTAQELMERLCQLKETETDAKKRLQSSSLTIALSGSKSGAGTTHIGIGLSVYLRNQGYPNLLEEKQDSFIGTSLFKFTKVKRDSCGLLYYRNLIIKPYYGPGVKLTDPPFNVRLMDWGENLDQAVSMEPDAVILVCDASIWNRIHACEAVEKVMKSGIPYAVIYNHWVIGMKIFIPKGAGPSAFFRAPFFPDPFTVCDELETFYQAVTNVILVGKKGSRKQNFQLKHWMLSMLRKFRIGERRLPGKD
nr:serine/threonine-protein kinase [uncultured Clostridium sp.]